MPGNDAFACVCRTPRSLPSRGSAEAAESALMKRARITRRSRSARRIACSSIISLKIVAVLRFARDFIGSVLCSCARLAARYLTSKGRKKRATAYPLERPWSGGNNNSDGIYRLRRIKSGPKRRVRSRAHTRAGSASRLHHVLSCRRQCDFGAETQAASDREACASWSLRRVIIWKYVAGSDAGRATPFPSLFLSVSPLL